jgi:hypothetical protein
MLEVKLTYPPLARSTLVASENKTVDTIGDVIATATAKSKTEELGNSALSRWWKKLLVVAWINFIIFQLIVGYDRRFSEKPLCPYSASSFGKTYWCFCFSCLGAFMMICLVLFYRVASTQLGHHRVPHVLALNIAAMGTIASWLSIVHEWGGVCIDAMNVTSHAASWADLLSTSPLLIFIAVTIVDKEDLSMMDWFMMATFYVCILTGFVIILQKSKEILWLIVSCALYFPVLCLPFYIKKLSGTSTEGARFGRYAEGYSKQTNVARMLCVIFHLLGVKYFSAMFGFIDPAQSLIAFQVLSVLTKGLFTNYSVHQRHEVRKERP